MELSGCAYSRCEWDLCNLWLEFVRWCVCKTRFDWLIGVVHFCPYFQGHVVMGANAISPYQQVIEKTKSLSFRSQMLAMNIEKKQAHSNRNEVTHILYIQNVHYKNHHSQLKAAVPPFTDQTARRSTWTPGSSKCLKWSAQRNKVKECWWTTINKSSLYTK